MGNSQGSQTAPNRRAWVAAALNRGHQTKLAQIAAKRGNGVTPQQVLDDMINRELHEAMSTRTPAAPARLGSVQQSPRWGPTTRF